MFDRFTDRAKMIMTLARQAALRLKHDYIGPEHVLLGMVEVHDCTAATALVKLGADLAGLRVEMEQAVRHGSRPTTSNQLPFTPAAKRVLELGMEEAAKLGHNHLGSEHLLLGVLAEGKSLGYRVLAAAGIEREAARAAIKLLLAKETAMPTFTLDQRLLLISNSTMHGGGYLDHCAAEIRDFLGSRKRVMFVPYALANHDDYTSKARTAFAAMGHELVSAHEPPGDQSTLAGADAVFVGGGNTFRLLKALYTTGLLPAIQKRVGKGMPYIGSSAGTNVATLSIRTTNDMPIVQPPSFTALELVPFQINPHYLDPLPGNTHMGETREERLRQFHEEHDTPVLGLREGCMLRVEKNRIELRGTTNARLFRRGEPAEEFTPPCDLSFLLQTRP